MKRRFAGASTVTNTAAITNVSVYRSYCESLSGNSPVTKSSNLIMDK